ncbi:MAG: FAD-dependent oxidoreductase [Methanobacteriaceae archaeon]|nr:FAD-dependent oxidoreductase [Methanobacteriaceae archaeon]
MKIVIAGGGAGGLSTASNIRKCNKNAEITVITKEKHIAYSPCAIPYVLGGEIKNFKNIIMHEKDDYLEKNIKIITQAEVYDVISSENKVKYRLKTGNDSNVKELSYDYLVIATGATSYIPPIEGTNLEGVFKIRTIEDGFKIKEWSGNSKHAVVVGASLIGLETSYALKQMGLKVTLTEMLPQIIPRSLDPDMAGIVHKYIEKQGIDVILNRPAEKILGEKQVEGVVFKDRTVKADMVILATGVRPQTKLAEIAGCKLGNMAIRVNEKMQTSVSNIYAVGDCVEVVDAITGEYTQSMLGTAAVSQGKIAAKNITGIGGEFKPVLNSMVSKVGELEFGAVGITKLLAPQKGIDVISGKIKALSKARYYPDAKRIDVKIICNIKGQIIGCQIIGEERVAERIDTMTLAISNGVTCSELATAEFSYAPPVSMVTDPIILAAEHVCDNLKDFQNNKITNRNL